MKPKINLTILYLLICLLGYGQNSLSIARTGKDKIVVYNPNYHAIAFEVGDGKTYILPAYLGIEIDFPLSNYSVENTTFTSFYNYDCFRRDSIQCELYTNQALATAERRAWWASITTSLLQGTNAGRVLDILNALFGSNKEVISEIMEAYKSYDTREQKILRINKILENYYIKSAKIEQNRESCIQNCFQRLNTNKSVQKFYVSQFIDKKENFRLELTPYYVVGFNTIQYRGQTNKRPAFDEIETNQQLPLGCRVSLNFNAYDKYKKRKIDRKLYLALDYSQSPVIYKKAPNGIFKKDTAYAWNFYSLGIGWETLYKNSKGKYNSSFSFDVGVVTSSNFKYSIDSFKTIKTKTKSNSFKEFNVYGCISLKQKVFSWLDLYGSYKLSANIFGKKENLSNREIPNSRQFELGVNLVLAKTVNYQY